MYNLMKIVLMLVVLFVPFFYFTTNGLPNNSLSKELSNKTSGFENKIKRLENHIALLSRSVDKLNKVMSRKTNMGAVKDPLKQGTSTQDDELAISSTEEEEEEDEHIDQLEITSDMDEETRQDVFERLTQKRKIYRDNLDQIIEQDGLDNDQTAKTREDIYLSIDQFSRNVAQIDEINCSYSYCKAVFMHDSPLEQEEFMEDIQGRPGFLRAGIAHTEFDEISGARTYIYLAEEGINFPKSY